MPVMLLDRADRRASWIGSAGQGCVIRSRAEPLGSGGPTSPAHSCANSRRPRFRGCRPLGVGSPPSRRTLCCHSRYSSAIHAPSFLPYVASDRFAPRPVARRPLPWVSSPLFRRGNLKRPTPLLERHRPYGQQDQEAARECGSLPRPSPDETGSRLVVSSVCAIRLQV